MSIKKILVPDNSESGLKQYHFAKSINGTDETGIIDVIGQKIICFCTKENSEIILKGLNAKEEEGYFIHKDVFPSEDEIIKDCYDLVFSKKTFHSYKDWIKNTPAYLEFKKALKVVYVKFGFK